MRILLVSIVAIIIGSSLMGCAMSNAEHRMARFRFEDYRDDKSLREALLELHPSGSSVEAARQTLERAGAKCNPTAIWPYGGPVPKDKLPLKVTGYSCSYFYTSGLVDVRLYVSVDGNEANEVRNFSASRQLTGM